MSWCPRCKYGSEGAKLVKCPQCGSVGPMIDKKPFNPGARGLHGKFGGQRGAPKHEQVKREADELHTDIVQATGGTIKAMDYSKNQ